MRFAKNFWFFLVIVMVGCQSNKTADTSVFTGAVPLPEVSVDSVKIDRNQGLAFYQGIPFTGVSVASYENDQIAEKITYLDGQRNGSRRKWFISGLLSYEATYVSNQLHGEAKSWWSNGNLRSQSNFQSGVADGTQKEWYQDGQLFKEVQLTDGREEGLQRAWRKNGKLYVNYEARNGRIFGLKRATLCYELTNENIVFND